MLDMEIKIITLFMSFHFSLSLSFSIGGHVVSGILNAAV